MTNVFIDNVVGIVKESYAGGDKPRFDWQTAIDMYKSKNPSIVEGMDALEIERQRSEFLTYVKTRKFDKNGAEIKTQPQLTDVYHINGEDVKITGEMIEDVDVKLPEGEI